MGIYLRDGYKVSHCKQYPEGTTLVYSNLTARGTRVEGQNSTVFFGLQYLIKKYLIEVFNETFFYRVGNVAVNDFKRLMDNYLGPDAVDMKEAEDLHDLGYLPICIKAVPEGTSVPLRVPMMTIYNTLPEFFWVTNALETLISNTIWLTITSATTAKRFKDLFTHWAKVTGGPLEFVPFQGHDFSMRGMSSLESACASGGAHLTSFLGTDTVPAIPWLEKYYNANSEEGPIGLSVPATEHSVMCLHGDENEFETFKDLILNRYPSGIISIVSDTWDFWKVVTEYLPRLKDEIMARDGKVVIRPDSGDPVAIVCGDLNEPVGSPQRKGLVQCLWEIFGGITNKDGYYELDPHIGGIYGDAITYERAQAICEQLASKGFASTNLVYGMGSYTYQYVTRDTYNMAIKATYGEINGEGREIFKDPKTDDGMKKSLKGLIQVSQAPDGLIVALDQQTWNQSERGMLQPVFIDGKIVRETNLEEIRKRIAAT